MSTESLVRRIREIYMASETEFYRFHMKECVECGEMVGPHEVELDRENVAWLLYLCTRCGHTWRKRLMKVTLIE